jgi:hypothetical protein
MSVKKSRNSKRTLIVLLLILLPIAIYLGIQIFGLYQLSYIFSTHPATNEDKALYKNYEAYAKKVMPSNFKLLESNQSPGTIDAATAVTQRYKISSTRKDVLNELVPIFKSDGYSFTESLAGTDIQGWQLFMKNSTSSDTYPLSISVTFIPSDPPCGPPGVSGCPLFPTIVKEVGISWNSQ